MNIRRFDDLGRIVIPKEIRRQIFGEIDTTGKQMEIFVEDNRIILQKCKEDN